MLPSSFEARWVPVSEMSSTPAALAATTDPGPGRSALAGLTLGIEDGLAGPAEQALQDLLSAGATMLDRSVRADPVAVLRDGGCDVVLASDVEGRLRRDAGRFGLFGFRTAGRPSDGSAALDGWGWLARDGAGFARIAEALLPGPATPFPDTPRCLIAADTLAGLDHDVRGALAPAIEGIEDLLGRAEMAELAPAGLGTLVAAYRQLQGDRLAGLSGAAEAAPALGPDVQDGDDRDEAEAIRAAFSTRLGRLLAADGLLVLPTLPDIEVGGARSPGIEDEAAGYLCPASLAGLPQVSLPLARLGEAPLGLSLIGPAGSDLSLCRVGVRIGRDLRAA